MFPSISTGTGIPTANGDGWASKKIRHREEDPPDEGGMMVEDMQFPRASFRDKLINSQQVTMESNEEDPDEAFKLEEDDAIREYDDMEPKITFKDRILKLV
ncbi:hypothetical protein AAHA92_22607 [Salvia divinorum]|uniref:Uncharacterized protein n=1 Tax=Salvia divinorum TaxID=28513 RepID=A0ABD1GP79_SALDI